MTSKTFTNFLRRRIAALRPYRIGARRCQKT
jgi:hypothetical protein